MSEQGFYLGRIDGINVIPSADIAPGYKRTVGSDIFVNEHNYELMRAFSAKGMIIALGTLREQSSAEPESDAWAAYQQIKPQLDGVSRLLAEGDSQ